MTDSATRQSEASDEAIGKGAVEEERNAGGEADERTGEKLGGQGPSLSGQLGHRDQDKLLKDNDTDFPEPDAAAEHS